MRITTATTGNDFDDQMIRLTTAYYNSRQIYRQNIELEEFISCVFDFVYSRDIKNRFDSSKGTLSTYIYNILDKNKNKFIYSIQHNMTYSEVRRLFKNPDDVQLFDFFSPLSISTPNHEEDKEIESVAGIKYDIEDKRDLINEYETSADNKQLLNRIIDYVNSSSFYEAKPKQRDIIMYFINNCTEQSQAQMSDHFNVSKQYFNYVIQGFRRRLRAQGINCCS